MEIDELRPLVLSILKEEAERLNIKRDKAHNQVLTVLTVIFILFMCFRYYNL